MKNIAIILAGGSGNRFASNLPKQFLTINNKTILEYSIEAFENSNLIDDIIIVANPNYFQETQQIVSQRDFKKL